MLSDTSIFGFVLLIFGTICISLLRYSNEKKLSPEEKKYIKAIRETPGFQWSWILIPIAVTTSLFLTRDIGLLDQNFTFAILFCSIAIYVIFQERSKKRKKLSAKIPISYQKTDAFIDILVPILFLAVGMIFLLS